MPLTIGHRAICDHLADVGAKRNEHALEFLMARPLRLIVGIVVPVSEPRVAVLPVCIRCAHVGYCSIFLCSRCAHFFGGTNGGWMVMHYLNRRPKHTRKPTVSNLQSFLIDLFSDGPLPPLPQKPARMRRNSSFLQGSTS